MLPVAVMILFSFNDPAGKSNFVWQGFTLECLAEHLRRSTACQSAVTISLGHRLRLDDRRDRPRDAHRPGPRPLRLPRAGAATNLFIFLPMATPEIVLGASLLTLFVAIGCAAVLPAQLSSRS